MRRPSLLLAMSCCLLVSALANSQGSTGPAEWRAGDVFVALGNGTYAVFHNYSGTYSQDDTITDPQAAGVSAGCASDATYHLITTNFPVSGLPTGAVNRWTMNAEPTFPHNVILTLPNSPAHNPSFPGGTSSPYSVVVDSNGNLYVGMAGGSGLMVEYPISNGQFGSPLTLPVSTNKVKGGTPWIDLSPDGLTIYFTNGSGSISYFPVSSKTIGTFPESVNGAKFFGFRILPGAVVGSSSPFMVAAAQSAIYLFDGRGYVLNTYSAPSEANFQFITLDPNGTSFWAGSPSTNKLYHFNFDSESPDTSISAGSGTLSGICAYGDFHAAQAQPSPLGTKSADMNDTVQFTAPDGNSTMKVTFDGGSPDVTAYVNSISPSAGFSDSSLTSDGSTLPPKSGPLACTPSPDANGNCLVWEIEDDHQNPTMLPPYSSAIAFSQNGTDGNTRLIRNGDADVTWLVKNQDPAGSTTRTNGGGISGYTLNQINASQTPDVFCGYTSPLQKQTFNFGSAVPFKFNAATSQANCANGVFTTKLTSSFRAPFLTVWQDGNGTTAGSQVPDVAVSGNSGMPPVYRSTGSGFILNLKTSNLTPGACYWATTYANEIPAAFIEFCLQ